MGISILISLISTLRHSLDTCIITTALPIEIRCSYNKNTRGLLLVDIANSSSSNTSSSTRRASIAQNPYTLYIGSIILHIIVAGTQRKLWKNRKWSTEMFLCLCLRADIGHSFQKCKNSRKSNTAPFNFIRAFKV